VYSQRFDYTFYFFIFILTGAFGGYLSAMQRHITRSTDSKTPFKVSGFHMLQGAAGAIIIVTLSPVDPKILSAPFATAADPTIDLFIKLIALALIGGYAGGSLLESSAKQYAKQIDEIGQRQGSMEDEQKRSLEAKRETEKILRGLEPSPAELARFEATVQQVSSFTRFDIANRADEVRRQHWQNDRVQLEWASLIFRSLLKTDDANSNHWWYASLGYCLKDQPRPDYAEALQCFNDAIKFRGQEARSGAYEFNRAYCYIKLDSLTTPKSSEQINRDLDAASKFPRFRDIIDACPDVRNWRNVIDAPRITKDAA
jgi:tetratricopeptide (TPR) repeat protein